jgi:hypothetical protein
MGHELAGELCGVEASAGGPPVFGRELAVAGARPKRTTRTILRGRSLSGELAADLERLDRRFATNPTR